MKCDCGGDFEEGDIIQENENFRILIIECDSCNKTAKVKELKQKGEYDE